MSKRKNLQGYRRRMRRALDAAGEHVPPRIGHGHQTGWKREPHRKSYAPVRSQMRGEMTCIED